VEAASIIIIILITIAAAAAATRNNSIGETLSTILKNSIINTTQYSNYIVCSAELEISQ